MFKLTSIFLPMAILSLQAGCTSSDTAETVLDNILNKDSVTLAKLSNNDITYEKTADGTTHTNRYCPSGVLKDTNDDIIGSWLVTGNDLTSNFDPTYITSNATLEINVTYSTDTADTYKITKITTAICL